MQELSLNFDLEQDVASNTWFFLPWEREWAPASSWMGGYIVEHLTWRVRSATSGLPRSVRQDTIRQDQSKDGRAAAAWPKLQQQEIATALERGDATLMAEAFRKQGMLTAKDVALAAQQGDALAQRIVHDTGCRLGEALAILVDILNPQRIVIGGLALRLGESLLGPARAAMQREAIGASAAFCQVVPASLGEQIGDIAAICVAMGL